MAPLILNLGTNGYEWLPQQSFQTLHLKKSPHPTTRNLTKSFMYQLMHNRVALKEY